MLVVEGLSWMLKHAEIEGKILGIKATRCAPSITYLMFADDIFDFCKANLNELKELDKIL